MIAGLEPYPGMKDSGLPWLKTVPEHWKAERAKWLFRKMNRPVQKDDEVVTCFRDGVVTLRKNRRVRGFTESLQEIGYQGIRRGDLVIHAMDAFAGAIGVADSDGKGTPVYLVCKAAPGADAHFYAYLVREMARTQWIQALATGIRERSTDFRFDSFGSQPVPLPPLPEQAAIVRFLEYADQRIRRYIRAKQKLIKLLEEQKKVIIHRAVTRGLDPNARLKPSGMDRLGDVPKHWQMRRLKDLSPRISGRLVYQPAQYFSDEGVPFIMGNNVTPDGIRWSGTKRIPSEVNARFAHHALREGDVVTVRVGAPGVTCVVPKEADGLNCGSLMIIRRCSKFNSQWLAYVMNSAVVRTQIAVVQYGAAQEQINIEDAVNFYIPVPSLEEQARIADGLRRETGPLSRVGRQYELSIDCIREYRTRLIADVVTGKLDVREPAAQLSEESRELDASEDADSPLDKELAENADVETVAEEAEA